MSKLGAFMASVTLLSSLGGALFAADAKVDGDGYVRDWLLLAPFSIPKESGAEEIDKKQIAAEGDLKPKAGDTQKIGEKEGAWKAVTSTDSTIDVNTVLGTRNEDVLAYLVTYVVADKDMPGLTLAIGSNDQAKIWLNGKEVHKFTETRGLEQDSDLITDMALKKGVNVIVFKLINQENNWEAALRFLDKDGNAVTGLGVKSAP